jgi:hypothetical protein
MNNVVVAPFGHNSLEHIKRQIAEGHARCMRGGTEWVEGSLQVAAALLAGRETMLADVSFKGWLEQNQLNFFSHQDRAALLNLAADIPLARAVLTEADSRSYRLIWAQNRKRFTTTGKPARKRRVKTPGRAMAHRIMKLGESVIDKIKGTSLDSAKELDELVVLNRGAPENELTEIVKKLVDDAASGKDVSAVAVGESMGKFRHPHRRLTTSDGLIAAWKKRMVASWIAASGDERIKLLAYLVSGMGNHKEREHVLMKLIDKDGE